MGAIQTYDDVIAARAAGRYYDNFLIYSRRSEELGQRTSAMVAAPIKCWSALRAADYAFEPAFPPPAAGRKRWLTYIESSFIDIGITVCDLLSLAVVNRTGYITQTVQTPPLTRYTGGDGVRIVVFPMLNIAGAYLRGNITVYYTNQDGVGGRIAYGAYLSSTGGEFNFVGQCVSTPSTYYGSLFFSSPFLSLQSGDTGVRSVEALGFPSAGINAIPSRTLAVALVRPLASLPPTSAGVSVASCDLLSRPEGPVELTVGSDGACASPIVFAGSFVDTRYGGPTGIIRCATVEI